MKQMSREVAMYLKSYNKTGPGLKGAADGLEKFRAGAVKVFAAIAKVATAAFTAVAVGAVAIGASFEQGLANTSSMFITAAKSAEELARWTGELSDKARELGASTAFTAREATNAMYALASGGMSAAEVVAAVDGVLKLAGATMTDMTATAETTMSTIKQFGLEASQTEEVVNVFAAGIQNSMLNMERLSHSMVYAGASMSAVGATVQETVAALALLHNAGLKGSMAGTGLRMAMTKLLKPTADLKKVLNGVSVESDGMAAVLDQLKSANLSATQMVEMFGARAFNAVKALVQAGGDGFRDMTDAVTGTNAATAMYEHQMNTVANQWKILRSGMEETGLTIFDELRDDLMRVIKWLQQVVEASRESFATIARNVVQGFRKIIDMGREAIAFFERHREVIETTAVVVASLAAGLFVLATAIKVVAVATAIATNPIALIAAGIIGATIAIQKFTGKSLNFADVWRQISHVVKNFGVYFKAGLQIAAAYWDAFWRSVNEGAKDILLQWEEIGAAFWMTLKAAFMTGLDALVAFVKSLKDQLKLVVGAFESVGSIIKAVFTGNLDEVPALAKEAWEQLKDDAVDVAANFKDVGKGEWEEVGKEWGKVSMAGFTNTWAYEMAVAWEKLQAVVYGLPPVEVKVAVFPRITDEEQAKIDLMGPFTDVAMNIPVKMKPIEELMQGPMLDFTPLTTSVKADTDKAMIVMDEFGEGMKSSMAGAWGSIIETSQSGSEKWGRIFDGVQQKAWDVIGKVVLKTMWGEKVKLKSVIMGEKGSAAAKEAGAAADTIASNTKVANATAENAANTGTAASGFFKAFSSVPFVGFALAAAAIAAMTKMLGGFKFAEGGIVNGPGGVDKVPAWLTDQEFVMPVMQTRKYLPILEAMRKGTFEPLLRLPALAAGGFIDSMTGGVSDSPALVPASSAGSGPAQVSVSVPVTIGPGSLLMADDDLATYRWAKRIWGVIEGELQQTYKET